MSANGLRRTIRAWHLLTIIAWLRRCGGCIQSGEDTENHGLRTAKIGAGMKSLLLMTELDIPLERYWIVTVPCPGPASSPLAAGPGDGRVLSPRLSSRVHDRCSCSGRLPAVREGRTVRESQILLLRPSSGEGTHASTGAQVARDGAGGRAWLILSGSLRALPGCGAAG
jgi:hypothetical protein